MNAKPLKADRSAKPAVDHSVFDYLLIWVSLFWLAETIPVHPATCIATLLLGLAYPLHLYFSRSQGWLVSRLWLSAAAAFPCLRLFGEDYRLASNSIQLVVFTAAFILAAFSMSTEMRRRV